jgi:hypothetical protein
MKLFTGWVAAAALVWAVPPADAQVLVTGAARPPYVTVSDFDGPYGAAAAPPPRFGSGDDAYEPGPLPAVEVYAVLREYGFLPLGIPRLRGNVYTIAVMDRRGDNGRLLIDARDGQIVRFLPADAMGQSFEEGAVAPYGGHAALPPPIAIRSRIPRPPAPIPHVVSRSVPIPKAAPPRGDVPQQSAAAQAKPAEMPTAAATVGQAKPAPTILPTQDMPPAQGLD